MIEMYRLIQPSSANRKLSGTKVHYQSEDGTTSLCHQARVFHYVDGEKMRMWYRTKRPVNCLGCTVILKGIVASEMTGLNGDQLEDLRQHIETFRRGFGNGHAR